MKKNKIKSGDFVRVLCNYDYAHKPFVKPYVFLEPGDIIKVLKLNEDYVHFIVDNDVNEWGIHPFTNYISINSVVLFKPCKCKILKKLNGCSCS